MATTNARFEYEKKLTDQDIIEQARIIAEASKRITEIREAQKEIKDLQLKIVVHSKYIQDSAIKEWSRGIFAWHTPSYGKVTVSFDDGYGTYYKPFEPFTRDMTQGEIEAHCELEIPFEPEDAPFASTEEEDDEDIREIFGAGRNEEEAAPEFEYIIEFHETNKFFPWSISEKRPLSVQPIEVFRTREQAEEFMAMFIVGSNAYHNIPGAKYQLNKISTGWEVCECGYNSLGEIATVKTDKKFACYYDAKEYLEDLLAKLAKEGAVFPLPQKEEPHILGGNDKYQIVEDADGHLTTIEKDKVA